MATTKQSKPGKSDDTKIPGRMSYATSSVPLPDGSMLMTAVELQEGGGVYVTHSFRRKDGGVEPGQTCFYCDGVKLGCITCPKGQSASGNCVNKTLSCVRDNAVGSWSPASVMFKGWQS